MKPTKKRYYCIGARKEKIHFNSREEAQRFLYYNAEAATDSFGRRPCRVYYCQECHSFHVTSQTVGRHRASFLQVYGEETGSEIYECFDALTGGKRQVEPILKKNIKELKRLMRFDVIECNRCQDVIRETIELFELSFEYGIGDRLKVHNLFERFSSLCIRFKEYVAA